jgi:hypothetical protein
MKYFFLIVLLLNSLASFAIDSIVSSHLSIDKLSQKDKIEVCMRSPLFTFVGNADEVFSALLPGSIPSGGSKVKKVDLLDIVNFQIEQLKESLFENDCSETIKSQMLKGSSPPQALFLAISDGPQIGDSQIQTFFYKVNTEGQWQLENNLSPRNWEMSNQKLLPASDKKFELHLPTQIENIIKKFADQKNNTYDQFFYFFKAHGTKFASKEFENNLLTHMSQKLPEEVEMNHAFMFDSQGPDENKQYSSELFLPYWMPLSGCRALSQNSAITPKYLSEHPGFCKCKEILNESSKPLYNFESCFQGGDNDDFIFGFDFNSNLGTSKSLFYRSFQPVSLEGNISISEADGIKQIGGAVSYNMTLPKVKGVETWSLPYGQYPTLILLDSCKGSPEVFNIIAPHNTKNSWKDRIVTITSENLVSDNVMSYWALNSSQYVLLSHMAAQEEEIANQEVKFQQIQDIKYHLSVEGLIDLKWVEKYWNDSDPGSLNNLKLKSLSNDNEYRYFKLMVH